VCSDKIERSTKVKGDVFADSYPRNGELVTSATGGHKKDKSDRGQSLRPYRERRGRITPSAHSVSIRAGE
jgi:hypothetical protein